MVVQVSQGDVRRYVGVASTVIGLVCYALSSSFNRLYGDWSPFKTCAYIAFSSIVCLAVLFPKAWQHLRIFHYRAHFTFLVLISTTVYSFYLDRKSKTKPDAYTIISSAALATTSLCMSKQIECGFLDLMYFFCGILVVQLMQIKLLLGIVGTGFSYFAVIVRSYLDAPPEELPRSQSQPQVVIDMALLHSWSSHASALDIRPQQGSSHSQAIITRDYDSSPSANNNDIIASMEELGTPLLHSASLRSRSGVPIALDITTQEGSIQNQAAITPVYSLAALHSVSLRSRSSTIRASLRPRRGIASLQFRSSTSRASLRSRTRRARALDIHQNRAITEEEANSPSAVDDIPSAMSSHYLYSSNLWTWIRTNHARVLEIFQDCQRSSWNNKLLNVLNESQVLMKGMLDLFNMHFMHMRALLSEWTVIIMRLNGDMRTSLAKILPKYERNRSELIRLIPRTMEIDLWLRKKGKNMKLE